MATCLIKNAQTNPNSLLYRIPFIRMLFADRLHLSENEIYDLISGFEEDVVIQLATCNAGACDFNVQQEQVGVSNVLVVASAGKTQITEYLTQT